MDRAEFRRLAYERYYTTHAQASAADRVDDPRTLAWRARAFDRTFGALTGTLPPDARVVDLGCGTGQVVWWLRERGFDAEGVDQSREQLEQAAVLVPRDRLREEDASDFLARCAGSLDALFFLNILEHLTRPEALDFLLAVRRALRPGGLLMLSVPN
ncbi:MAG: class I SAM-dependent methyltransferase, partial [Myxococcota bacterium]